MIALFLLACAARTPPQVFAGPLVAPPPLPPPVERPVAPDACPETRALLPGKPAPYTEDGIAICRAQVVPELQVYDLIEQADAGVYWSERSQSCEAYRIADRQHAQAASDTCWSEAEYLRGELRWSRAVAPAAFVGGVVVGIGVGIAAAAVSP